MADVWKLLGSNMAEIIATCALLFTAYEAHLSRKHNRISVTPRLATFAVRNSENGAGCLEVKLSNKGVGPAVVESFHVELDGDPREFESSKEMLAFIEELVGIISIKCSASSFLPGHILAAGESLTIMELRFLDENGKGWQHIEKLVDRLALRVRYSSLYGERFEYHSIETHS